MCENALKLGELLRAVRLFGVWELLRIERGELFMTAGKYAVPSLAKRFIIMCVVCVCV